MVNGLSNERGEEGSCGVVVATGCCRLEAVVSIDERGQIVLPKDLREKAGITAGDKLVIVASKRGEKVCCIMLMRAEELTESIKQTFGPLLAELVK